jgi:hypothetical protein
MVMGSYMDQKNAMELAIASGKTVFTGPQAAAFNAIRMSMVSQGFQLPSSDGARALPSTFPLHVRATALVASPSSAAHTPEQCAADDPDVQAFTPTAPLMPPAADIKPPHPSLEASKSATSAHQPPPKPLLSFSGNFGAHDSAFYANIRHPQRDQSVPLLPTSTLLSSDPSHFEQMLKEWSRSITQPSSGGGAAAAVTKPAVRYVEVDEVLCIDSAKAAALDPAVQVVLSAGANDCDDEVIVVSDDSGDEGLHQADARTPVQGQRAIAFEAAAAVHGIDESKPSNLTPRGILNFFSPITKRPCDEAVATQAAAPPLSSAPALPLIINPVFTEVSAEPATTCSVVPAAASPAPISIPEQNPSPVPVVAPSSASNPSPVPADGGNTFSISVSMISGRTLPTILPRDLLQRSPAPLDDVRGDGVQSPFEEHSDVVSFT